MLHINEVASEPRHAGLRWTAKKTICVPCIMANRQDTPISLSGVVVYSLHHNATPCFHQTPKHTTRVDKQVHDGRRKMGASEVPLESATWLLTWCRKQVTVTHNTPQPTLTKCHRPEAFHPDISTTHSTPFVNTGVGVGPAVQIRWQPPRIHQHHHQQMRPGATQNYLCAQGSG